MTPAPLWPWYDPTTAPPPSGVEVLIRKRDGKYATGKRLDGKWLIGGRMMPASVVSRWTLIPPDGE